MRIGYFLILMVLFGNIFGCQSVAQNNNQTNQNNVAVKSDPLKLRLNNEEKGTTDNPSALTKKLEEVFQDRMDNGIFREGTNELESAVHLATDRSVSADDIAKLFEIVKSSGANRILIPVEMKKTNPRPNPLTLLVYAGVDKYRPFNAGIEMGAIEEMSDDFPNKDAVAVVVDKNGAYTFDGKQVLAIDLKKEIETRLKNKAKDDRIVFVQAENYGNMEDAASIAHSAGAVKVNFVTKSIAHTEEDIAVWKEAKLDKWNVKFSIPRDLKTIPKPDDEKPDFTEDDYSESFTFERLKPKAARLEVFVNLRNIKGERVKTERDGKPIELTPEELVVIDFNVNSRDANDAESNILEAKYHEIDGVKGVLLVANSAVDAGKSIDPKNKIRVFWGTYRISKGNVQQMIFSIEGKRTHLETMMKIINSLKFN